MVLTRKGKRLRVAQHRPKLRDKRHRGTSTDAERPTPRTDFAARLRLAATLAASYNRYDDEEDDDDEDLEGVDIPLQSEPENF